MFGISQGAAPAAEFKKSDPVILRQSALLAAHLCRIGGTVAVGMRAAGSGRASVATVVAALSRGSDGRARAPLVRTFPIRGIGIAWGRRSAHARPLGIGAVEQLDRGSSSADEEHDREDQPDDEEDPGDVGGRSGNAGKPENASDYRYYKKDQSPIQH